MIDSNNQLKVPFVYAKQGLFFYKALAVVNRSQYEGLIDNSGKIRLSLIYNFLEGVFCDDYMYYERSHKSGYIRTDFKKYPRKKYNLKVIIATKFVKDAPKVINRIALNTNTILPKTLLKKSLLALLYRHSKIKSACSIEEHLVYYGLPDAFLGNFMEGENLDLLKKEFIFPIISSEILRYNVWLWVLPYYKKCFSFLPKAHQLAYKRILKLLKAYMGRFNKSKVEQHLKENKNYFERDTWERNLKPS